MLSRRTVLASTAVLGTGGLAGCLGRGGASNTHLPPPDTPADPEDLAYPAYGQPLPEVTIPAPLQETTVSPRDMDRTVLMTFYFSYCESVCPRLIDTLRNVQTAAVEGGYGDQIAFLPVTFDPERDTTPRFEEYADAMRIDLELGNWYFLRPDGPDRAEQVVSETFGLHFERTEPDGSDGGYMFAHMALILLVNPSGYVERAYPDQQPVWQDIEEDTRRVIEASD